MNLLRTPPLLAFLLAPSLVPACTPGKLCIGDCTDSPADDASTGDAPFTGEPPGASETGIGATSESGDQPTTDATNPTSTDDTGTGGQEGCGIPDSFDPLAGCADGVQNPGEFCFIESFSTDFPTSLVSTVAVELTAGSTDLLVTHSPTGLSALLDDSGPEFDLTQKSFSSEFPPGTLTLTSVGDLDEDGNLDAVGFNRDDDGDVLWLFLFDAMGDWFGGSTFHVGTVLFGPVVVDWDQDGHRDLVVVTPSEGNPENVLLLRGDGVTNFASEPQFGITATADMRFALGALGPVDDGVADDFVFADADGSEVTILVRAPGELLLSFDLEQTAHIHQIEIADVDADGRGDVVILADSDGVSAFLHVLLQTGPAADPSFAPTTYPVVCGATTFALGDIDGDGALDAVAGAPNFTSATVRRGDGMGGLGAVFTRDFTVGPDRLHIADFTGDGSADIVSVNNAAATVSFASNTP